MELQEKTASRHIYYLHTGELLSKCN